MNNTTQNVGEPEKALKTPSDVVRYLSDTNTRVLTYHNHKEVSAWGGVLFFYAFASAVSALIEKHIGCKALIISGVVLVAAAVFFYIVIQLKLRRAMGHLTIVLPRLCCKIFSMTTTEFDNLDWTISDLGDGAAQYEQSVPRFVSDEFSKVAGTKHRARKWLEVLPVVLFFIPLLTVIAITLTSDLPQCWFKPCRM